MDLLADILSIPDSYSQGMYRGRRYGISRITFNQGQSFKIYAEELGGNDVVSLNFYILKQEILRPCEMPVDKVVDFLRKVVILNDKDE